jgi:hypothetical protein
MGQRQASKVGTYEKWDQEIELLMRLTTIFHKKQNDLMLQVLQGNVSAITHLPNTKHYRALQVNLSKSVSTKV